MARFGLGSLNLSYVSKMLHRKHFLFNVSTMRVHRSSNSLTSLELRVLEYITAEAQMKCMYFYTTKTEISHQNMELKEFAVSMARGVHNSDEFPYFYQ
jgi:hypothetical protein